MNTCPHCGIGFKAFFDFEEHLTSQHTRKALESNPKALLAHSRSTSGRTKAQIVHDAEMSWLLPALVGRVTLEHSSECRCHLCWLKLADTILENQAKELGL